MSDYIPKLAIVVYHQDNSTYYLESHRINKDGGMGEGKPLKKSTLQKLVSGLSDSSKIEFKKELHPDKLLLSSYNAEGTILVWYCRSSMKKLFFNVDENAEIETVIPSCIFVLKGNSLYVYSYREQGKPKENTILYNAPFPNIYQDGRICMGNMKLEPKDSISETIKHIENLFFNSEFNHSLSSELRYKTDLMEEWLSCSPRRIFDKSKMIRTGLKLKDLIRKL